MTKKIKIDQDTADRITVTTLKNYRSNLKKELKNYLKNPKTDLNPAGYWMHPGDIVGNRQRIDALDLIIGDYPQC